MLNFHYPVEKTSSNKLKNKKNHLTVIVRFKENSLQTRSLLQSRPSALFKMCSFICEKSGDKGCSVSSVVPPAILLSLLRWKLPT